MLTNPTTSNEVVMQNGSLVTAAKDFAEALAAERLVQQQHAPRLLAGAHLATQAAAGRLANLLADRLADSETDPMFNVHATNYFTFLMEQPEAEA